MIIRSAEFITSAVDVLKCPPPKYPEYAFWGRSNVGKSSLINMLVNRKNLARISGTPGKTQHINHFLINEAWYLVDLPGYGFAKVPKTLRQAFSDFIAGYLNSRPNLICLFLLIDARLPFQKIDHETVNWLGENGIPFCFVYTKTDKVKPLELEKNVASMKAALKNEWESLPTIFFTSSEKRTGRDEILKYIQELNTQQAK